MHFPNTKLYRVFGNESINGLKSFDMSDWQGGKGVYKIHSLNVSDDRYSLLASDNSIKMRYKVVRRDIV